jgi:hypothetical protein
MAVRNDCGHRSGGPTDVLDQSSARINSPISPPFAKNPEVGLDVGIEYQLCEFAFRLS